MSVVEIEDGVYEATAAIDNGSFGKRTIRFETGRLAKQAAGSVVAYLDDDTMLLSATTAGKKPREGFDFFPEIRKFGQQLGVVRADHAAAGSGRRAGRTAS